MKKANRRRLTVGAVATFLISLLPLGGWLLPDPFHTHDDGGGGRFDGRWRGTITRSSGDRWELDITIDVARRTGRFEVSSATARCSGDLTVLEHSDDRLSVLERLVRADRGTCAPRAYITLSLAGGRVHAVWEDAGPVNVTGKGDLTRG
ncbi:hypothetical protein [Actinomadura chokoriensis]|uniref:META domain-containing protein n=1 Tax=Actinomadura chokoriensis TaxID=454156 RepID=A0ABV4R5W4_9ACTN